jgi:hypothetical protein
MEGKALKILDAEDLYATLVKRFDEPRRVPKYKWLCIAKVDCNQLKVLYTVAIHLHNAGLFRGTRRRMPRWGDDRPMTFSQIAQHFGGRRLRLTHDGRLTIHPVSDNGMGVWAACIEQFMSLRNIL